MFRFSILFMGLLVVAACVTPTRSGRGRSRRDRVTTRSTQAVSLPGCPRRAGRSAFDDYPGLHVRELAFDIAHVCARMSNGTVRCLGENANGELGARSMNARNDAHTPSTLVGVESAVEVITGRRITCVRHRNGTVRCLGSDEGGQLGTGHAATPDARGVLLPVQNLTGATQLSTSLGTVCARLGNGTLRCWGRESEAVATPVPEMSGLEEFDLEGMFHGCGRFREGSVRCGRFARAVSVRGATQLDAGPSHACARLDDGTVRCWGFNSSSQLGVTTSTMDAYTPVDPGVRCVTQVAVGGDHTCVLITDGTVRCWGGNHFAQLGDGTTVDRATPTSVPGVTSAVRIFAGAGTTCALQDDGTVLCWGQSLWLPGSLPSIMLRPREVRW